MIELEVRTTSGQSIAAIYFTKYLNNLNLTDGTRAKDKVKAPRMRRENVTYKENKQWTCIPSNQVLSALLRTLHGNYQVKNSILLGTFSNSLAERLASALWKLYCSQMLAFMNMYLKENHKGVHFCIFIGSNAAYSNHAYEA